MRVKQTLSNIYWSFVRRLKTKPRLRLAIWSLLLLLLAISAARIVREPAPFSLFSSAHRSDFEDYYEAARLLSRGRDPYHLSDLRELRHRRLNPDDFKDPLLLLEIKRRLEGLGSYLYPPFTAWLLQPLSYFDYRQAAILFQILSLVSLAGFFLFLERKTPGESWHFHLPALLGALIMLRFLLENAANGNIGFFLLLLCGSGLVLAWERRPWTQLLGGGLIGVAIMIKVTPAFLVLVLLAGRRYRALFGLVGGLILTFLLPVLTLGWERNWQLFQDWRIFLLENFQRHGIIRPWANNQTVSALIGKLFLPGADGAQSQFGLPLLFANRYPDAGELRQLSMVVRGLNGLLYLLALGTSLFVFAFQGRREKGGDLFSSPSLIRLLSLVLLISLVGSGVSWYHAYSILLLPLFFRLYQSLVAGQQLLPAEKMLVLVLFVFGFLSPIFPPVFRKLLAIYSVFAWLILATIILYLGILWRREVRIFTGGPSIGP